jgi:hypothetical protein
MVLVVKNTQGTEWWLNFLAHFWALGVHYLAKKMSSVRVKKFLKRIEG